MGPGNDAVSSFVAMQNFEQFQDQIKPGKSGSTQLRGNKENNRTEQNKRVNLVRLTTDANLCENLFKQSVMQVSQSYISNLNLTYIMFSELLTLKINGFFRLKAEMSHNMSHSMSHNTI